MILLFLVTLASAQDMLPVEDLQKEGAVQAIHQSLDDKFSVRGGTVTGPLYMADKNAVSIPLARKNAIINGNFDLWQRTTSSATIADGTYTADRFKYIKSGAAVHTVSRSATVPTLAESGTLSNYSLLADVTTVDSSIAAGDYSGVKTVIEGYDWARLAQKTFTLSFWVRSTKTGTFCVAFVNSGNDRSYVAEYTVATTNSWEREVVTVPASPSAGTWDYTNGAGLAVYWMFAAGSTYHTTANAWNTGNFLATSNQVNATDSASNNFHLAQVQLESGDFATPFEFRPFALEVEMARRYYRKSYNLETDPGTVTTAGAEFSVNINTADFYDFGGHTLRGPPMRGNPTMVQYNPATGASGTIRDYTGAQDDTTAFSDIGQSSYRVSTGLTGSNNAYGWHWTADSEL